MKIENKTTNPDVAIVINEAFSLLIKTPYLSFTPIVDSHNTFHLLYGKKEDEEKWYQNFIESVVDYCKTNKINIGGRLSKNKITFEDVFPLKE